MAKKIATLLPSTDELLHQFGERLRLARLRRGLSAKQVCERAGMAPMTLRSLENGGSGVTIGAYLAVMQVLGIEQDLNLLGQADTLGRSLQDSRLPKPTTLSTQRKKERKATLQNNKKLSSSVVRTNFLEDAHKAPRSDYTEMACLAAGGNALEEARKALGPDYTEMARLAAGGNALEEARKALGLDYAEMTRLAAGGNALEEARKALGPDYAEMARLAAGGNALEEARKALGPDYAEMARLAAGGNALEEARKALGPDYAEMARLAAEGNALEKMRKSQEANIFNKTNTNWENEGGFISSDLLSHLIALNKKGQ